jgi:alpha-amylase
VQPDDLVAIFSKFRANMGGALPADFVAWLEVLLGGEADLLMCDPDSGYNYGSYLADGLSAAGFSDAEVEQIKIWNSGYPKEPANGYCTITPSRNAIQNDDADQQTEGSTSRDMGDDGCVLIEDCADSDEHRAFEVKLFENPNGIVNDNDVDYPIRLILSSFWWQNSTKGIPDGLSDCSLCTTNCDACVSTEKWGAFDDSSTGYDDEYTRPHRDADVVAAMQSWMGL